MPAEEAAMALANSPIERADVLYREEAGAGVTGAAKIRVHFADPPIEVFLK